jgi:hypothetical protein
MKHECKLMSDDARSLDSAVDIATGYGLDDRGIRVRVLIGSRIFFPTFRPDVLWRHPASYPTSIESYFLGGSSGRGVKLITHFQLMPRSRKLGSIHSFLRFFSNIFYVLSMFVLQRTQDE